MDKNKMKTLPKVETRVYLGIHAAITGAIKTFKLRYFVYQCIRRKVERCVDNERELLNTLLKSRVESFVEEET